MGREYFCGVGVGFEGYLCLMGGGGGGGFVNLWLFYFSDIRLFLDLCI